jgi:hypothetical protein
VRALETAIEKESVVSKGLEFCCALAAAEIKQAAPNSDGITIKRTVVALGDEWWWDFIHVS